VQMTMPRARRNIALALARSRILEPNGSSGVAAPMERSRLTPKKGTR
jgi:hypothetical protein